MSAACCSTALFPLPRTHPRHGVVSSKSVSQPQLSNRFGLSFRVQRRLEARKSVRVSCIGGNKTAVVTGKSWDKLILNSDIPVLVEFYASWCGPCRMVHRVIDEIATDYSGRLKCFVLDADNDPKTAEDYDIKAVPVVLLFKNGGICDSIVGTMPKEFYVAAIERVLASVLLLSSDAILDPHCLKRKGAPKKLRQKGPLEKCTKKAKVPSKMSKGKHQVHNSGKVPHTIIQPGQNPDLIPLHNRQPPLGFQLESFSISGRSGGLNWIPTHNMDGWTMNTCVTNFEDFN